MPAPVSRTQLPEIEELRRKAQSLALLDLILCQQWEYRIYLFDSKWSETAQMASISQDQGDALFLVFAPSGCFIVGFFHETIMSQWARDDHSTWPGIFEHVPDVFRPMVEEPAFDTARSSTFCVWRQTNDPTWSTGPVIYPENEDDPDGSEEMLKIYKTGPEAYQEYASEYFEKTIALPAIRHIYEQNPLNEEVIRQINPEADVDWVLQEAKQMGYPTLK
jgi:hypothetical protein